MGKGRKTSPQGTGKPGAIANDPHADREAEKYENPVPSREYIMQVMAEIAEPVSYEHLCDELELEDEDECEGLRRRLIAMSRDGQLISNRRGVYGLVDRMELLRGRVQGSKDGFGFFIPADKSGDLFLGPKEMKRVFDGDIVLARVSGVDRRGRKEGMIVEVLERSRQQIVGRFYREDGFSVVVPDNRRISQEIVIPERDTRGAEDGQFVVAEVTAQPDRHRKPAGRITEILGDHMAPGMEIDVALRSHDLPWEWPEEVARTVDAMTEEVGEDEKKNRIDVRDLPFVTIDGEDAKDFDDALYCAPGDRGGYTLYVAIADVSYYVTPDSPLDREAQNRGNSVYFPGHVIPMLPEIISNGLCSLKPKVDRLAMVCEMSMTRAGKLKDYRFFEGVMHSHARLTYTEVSDMLEDHQSAARRRSGERLRQRHDALLPDLERLFELYRKLRANREQAGALDFGSNETRIVFGETRKIREIVPVERTEAHRLVEECMLAANVCTARFLESSKLPVLYRVHEGPNADKLETLRAFLNELGFVLSRSSKPKPKDYQRVLQEAAERPDGHLIQTMLVRSMMQAVYQPENLGHFGLGFEAYTHFTSPIRRYPDLLVHRALRFLIRKTLQRKHVRKAKGASRLSRKEIYPYDLADMEQFGDNCSVTERRADAAVYDVLDWLKCEYIEDRVGEEFDGTIASVTGFGLFVQLNDIYVEGLVHITALQNDYYQFDPARQHLRGERSGITYQLGGSVRVKVARVDLNERKIDLVLADDEKQAAPAGKKKSRSGSGGGRGKGGQSGEKKPGGQRKKPADQKAGGKASGGGQEQGGAEKPAGSRRRRSRRKKD
ncbi:MAG: ribonuclease R [Pseudohongiellaceae bacterium]